MASCADLMHPLKSLQVNQREPTAPALLVVQGYLRITPAVRLPAERAP